MARILLIDDDEIVRMTVVQALEFDGHTVTEASDGDKGIAAFQQSDVELVITDLLMPNKEGIETIMELRQISPGVKIIAISGGGRMQGSNILDMADRLGANAVLKKPFQLHVLRDTVKACLEPVGGA